MIIIKKQKLSENIHLIQLKCPEIAKKAKPGQFVLLQLEKKSARIPLPIADADKISITLVFEAATKETKALAASRKNQDCFFVLGPLGKAREIKEVGKVLLVGEKAGIGPLFFYAKALKGVGNKVSSLLGGLSKKTVFWQEKIEKVSDKTFVIDAKSDFACPLTHAVEQVLRKIKVDQVITIASPDVMRSIAHATKLRTKHFAYLTATMLDGIGMCGSCRVQCHNEQKLCCMDGPELDAHGIDWESYLHRLKENV